MKKYIPLAILAMLVHLTGHAQISITTSNTASICYNDGTLTINASGGAAPYTDSILSGPVNPNLSYPIALPAGQNVFHNLPHGAFTVRVHDAAGNSGTFSANVGGTYEFPHDTIYQTSRTYWYDYTDTVICVVDSSTGMAPYEYAISSTGPNAGFGPYQNGNLFGPLCPNIYWLRVRDACGNIYTQDYNVTVYVNGWVNCTNLSTGQVSLGANNGIRPYTFTIYDHNTALVVASNHTGNFNLPPLTDASLYDFTVSDSCGTTYNSYESIHVPMGYYSASCPFTGSLEVSESMDLPNDPVVVTCLNCSPVQVDTLNVLPGFNQQMFSGLVSGNTYYFRQADACGNVRIDTVQIAPTVFIQSAYTSCRSIKFTYQYNNGNGGTPIPLANIDSTVLTYMGVRYVSFDGTFHDLPANNGFSNGDSVEVFTNIGCNTKEYISFNIPNLSMDMEKAKGPNCDPVWNAVDFAISPEKKYIISSLNDTTYGQPIPGVPNDKAYYFLQPNTTYTVVSDSGCSAQITTAPIHGTYDSVTSYVDCNGTPYIYESCFDSIYYNYIGHGVYFVYDYYAYATKFYQNGSLVYSSDSVYYNDYNIHRISLKFIPPDTGWYTYKTFRLTTRWGYYDTLGVLQVFGTGTTYDTLCPQDTGSIYVTRSTVPFPYVNTAYKCNGQLSAAPHLTIYGGSIPYTIQIAGVDTFMMYTNTTIFPSTATGSYSVIAYDDCGISRSFTFTIYDTCAPCGTVRIDDTTICKGSSAQLSAIPQNGGGTYSWTPGGETTQSIIVSPLSTATYHVSYTYPNCAPVSDSATVSVSGKPANAWSYTGSGTTLHFTDLVTSGAGPFTYLWDFGDGSSTSGSSSASHNYSAGGGQFVVTLIVTSPCGNDTSAQTIILTGMESISLDRQISVYPNPSQGAFTIVVGGYAPAGLSADIMDAAGRSLYKQSIHTGENKLDLDLAAGIYMIKVSDGQISTVKVMSIK